MGKGPTEQDWLLAQALTYYESQLCDGCGQPMWLSMDPDLEFRWHAELPARCHSCTAVEVRMKDYEKADNPRALRFSSELKPAQ